ncbi:glycosyltransferase family 2 protein [Bergeyella sp. RCAD1439]|uniref:glycosyltransferase family 2 protein n=1 Tax=Bergeyella anatis TaxID=3113737 RepID=UPI002E177434|nr:glycosyltransferase [Bergeyella sp. RCAD1439]
MKFLIVIPAHNEARYLAYSLQSLCRQTYADFEVVVVNDGSTDATGEIAEAFGRKDLRFKVIHLEESAHSPGGKVVKTFNRGLESRGTDGVEVVCKFDADVVFPENYLEVLAEVYRSDAKIGMVSGLVFVSEDQARLETEGLKDELLDFSTRKGWRFENLSSKKHVRGPVKSYRRACFKAMGGLRGVLGWDNIDVMLAEMHGWSTVTVAGLWVKHLRPTAYKYKSQRAQKLGQYFYNIGLDAPLAMIASAKAAYKNRSVSEFFVSMKAFWAQKEPRVLSASEIRYIRRLRWRRMRDTLFGG